MSAHRDQLAAAVDDLARSLAVVIADLTNGPFGVDNVDLVRDMQGRYIVLDARAAYVNGLAALARVEDDA